MTQINTPYPSTAYLSRFLQEQGHQVTQNDLGLDLILKIFSEQGLARVRDEIELSKSQLGDSALFFLEAFDQYQSTIDDVIRFLQGNNPSLALRIVNQSLLPEGPRFSQYWNYEDQMQEIFGELSLQDKAQYFASLYLDDLADVIKQGVDQDFEFSRYGERLASSQPSFTPLYNKLKKQRTLIDEVMDEILCEYMTESEPELVGLSVPFPGNMLGALRVGSYLKKNHPAIKVVMGGGFANTELRSLSDSRLFEYTDYLTFDDGELPLKRLTEFLKGQVKETALIRTWTVKDGEIVRHQPDSKENIPYKQIGPPDYSQLPLAKYISMMELPNPMHRLWSGFRWNKMILAHGCYWHKCTFCDVNLDYIGRFEPAQAKTLVDQIGQIIKETGSTGFHFVDEAAPPALLKAFSKEIIKRKINITWWGNLRFDIQFDQATVELMRDAGCIAVTGGLEVASPRLLKLINKGVTIDQVAEVTHRFTQAGIYVHAYLMYGFPSQTKEETIESLEVVRQLFVNGCIHSAHWHRFLCTIHSPIGKNPEKFGIQLLPRAVPKEGLFSQNEIPFRDSIDIDHDWLGKALHKAVYNYMHGIGLDQSVETWFQKDE
ncbi:MAG: radical SAM protein [Oligoflexia bacterium]|nr:MAG: radical SAM protein [Oligoflexia bacterium]